MIDREPERALKIEACFVKLEEVPMVTVRNSTCPFDRFPPRASEPVSSLLIPFVSELASEREPLRFLASPLIWEPVIDTEPVSVLNSEECSTNVETGDSKLVAVLNRERWSLKLAAPVSEPLNVLKMEECSARIEDGLIEADRFLANPLVSEPVRENESVNDLTSEMCLVIVDTIPIEPFNSSTRPLESVVAMPRELPRDLPRPLVSEFVRETDPIRTLAKPLLSDSARVKEKVSVLEIIICSTRLEDVVSDPARAL